jgi:hypothetical protein
MRGARASIATLVATAAIALGALGLAVAAPGQPRTRVEFSASGALALTSSRDGETLFAADQMRPGQAVSGTLRITNTGETGAILAVRTSGVNEHAGTGGGLLSGRLALIVSDVSGDAAPVQLWAGRPADLAEARLAILAKGESRDLVVTAALAAAGATNAYQGASVSLGLTWGVRPVADGLVPTATPTVTPGPTRTPTPVPTATPNPIRTPAPVSTPTPVPTTPPATTTAPPAVVTPPADVALDVAADELGLPGANACLSRRKFKIHLRGPRGAGIALAVVRVGSKPAKRIQGRGRHKVAAVVSLRGFTKRKVTVKVGLRTTDGHRYRSKRTYGVCAGR